MKIFNVTKIILVVMMLLAVCAPLFLVEGAIADTEQPSSVTLHDMAVFNSLISDNDTLFVVPYDIEYGTAPLATVDDTFIFSLMDGSNLLGAVTAYPFYNYGYGQGVVSFYFSANSSIVWGTAYNIVVAENPAAFTAPRSFSFPLSAGMYSAYSGNQTANQALLQTKITLLAQQLTIYWGMTATPLFEQGGSGIILSSYGEAYFRNAIYGLQVMCPSLFLLQSTSLVYLKRSWDYSFAAALQNTFAGSWIYTNIIAGFSGIWDVPTSTSLSFISFLVAIVIFCISVGLAQNSPQSVQGAFLDGATVLIFASLSGFFSPIINVTIAFMFVFVGGWILLMSKA